jgi:hypothetical protein
VHTYLNQDKILHFVARAEINPFQWLSLMSKYLNVITHDILEELFITFDPATFLS